MQLPRRRRRPIQQSFRTERPLVYEHWSDPILVKRANDGDTCALAVLSLFEDQRAGTDADPVREADRGELRQELNCCPRELAPIQAQVVVVKDAFGLSYDQKLADVA